MRKLIIISIAVLAIIFSAKAQSIRVLNSCYIEPKTFIFNETDAYGKKLKSYTIESYCPQKQFPSYRVNVGNYEFKNLPISENEEWSWFIERNGKTFKKGTDKDLFWIQLGENDRLTILIYSTQSDNTSANGF